MSEARFGAIATYHLSFREGGNPPGGLVDTLSLRSALTGGFPPPRE